MDSRCKNLTRRKFMVVGSAAIASPLLLNLIDPLEEAKAAAKAAEKAAEKSAAKAAEKSAEKAAAKAAEKSAEKSAAKAAARAANKDKIYYITNQCIGCHACKVFCPQKAIYYGERKMEIDQDKCVQCGTCYNECPICVIDEVKL